MNDQFKNATPRPWRVLPGEDLRHHSIAIAAPWESYDCEPYHAVIVSCKHHCGHAPYGVALENAALIVKSVNEYEALCAVVEAARLIDGCSEIRPNETPGAYKARILEPIMDELAALAALRLKLRLKT